MTMMVKVMMMVMVMVMMVIGDSNGDRVAVGDDGENAKGDDDHQHQTVNSIFGYKNRDK